jgi:hypothetical protein
MRDLNELNMNEGGQPVTRQPPTDAQVADFDSHFGVILPKEYVAFLRHSNGGHPEQNSFRPKGLVEDVRWGVNRFYHLSQDQNDLEGLWGAATEWRQVIAGNTIPIGNDGGGNQLLLSFDHAPPSVEICIHDENMRLIHVADSFGEFIDMLTEDPDMI